MKYIKGFEKAVVAFVLALIAALEAEVQSGATFNVKTVLLAAGTAVLTAAGVYSTPNSKV